MLAQVQKCMWQVGITFINIMIMDCLDLDRLEAPIC